MVGCLTAIQRLAFGAVPLGFAVYINSAMGWLVLSCTALVVFCLDAIYERIGPIVRAEVDNVVNHQPELRRRQAEAEQLLRDRTRRWSELDTKFREGADLNAAESREFADLRERLHWNSP